MIKLLSLLLLLGFSSIYANDLNDKVLAEVGNEKINYEQLQRAYAKNLNRGPEQLKDLPRDSLYDFVNLYINYRLKVLDAIDKGYLNDSAVIAEYKGNRKLLAESFFFEKKLMKPKIDLILERRKWDIRFAYIIIPKNMADSSTTSQAEKKADEAMKKIKAGVDFAEVAKEYSADPQTKDTGGMVASYITGGKIQRPLENALYSLEPGEIYPNILETNYGYFILKLVEKKKRELAYGSHILVGSVTSWNEEDSIRYDKKADSLISLLNSGADFAELARVHSDDESTKENGGSFGEYYSRSSGFQKSGSPLLKSFEDGLFALKDGEISGKVWTEYGAHIIRRDSSKILDREEEFKEVKKLYKRIYYNDDKEFFIDSISRSYEFTVFDNVLNDFVESVDTQKTTLGVDWDANVNDDLKNKQLFQFNKKLFTVDDFIFNANKNPDLRGTPLTRAGIKIACRKIIEDDVFEMATASLDSEFPEFAALLKEFQDGIILFKAENEEVWQKREFDSTLAKTYWDSTKSKYLTNYQIDFSEIFVLTTKDANDIKKALDNGASFDSLAKIKTQRSGYREKKGRFGLMDAKRNKVAQIIDTNNISEGQIQGPIETPRGFSIFKIHKVGEPRVKTFDEAFSEVAPKVQDITQNQLREKWLNRVKEKHAVKINNDVIDEILEN